MEVYMNNVCFEKNTHMISARSIFTRLLLGVALLCLGSGRLSAQWVHTGGPYFAAYTRGVAVSGSNLFCASNDGIWLSTDNGASWNFVDNGPHVATNAVVPIGTRLFAATSGSGVYISTDNGVNWTQSNSGLSNLNVWSFTASSTGNVFAATLGGVFRSTNNGASWTAVNTGLGSLLIYSLASNGTTLLAGAGGSGAGIYRSTNDGASWTLAGAANSLVLSFAVMGTNVLAASNSGVFRSTNNGASWSQANSGLPTSTVNCIIASGSSLYAGITNYGVYVSTNSGQSWAPTNPSFMADVKSLAVNGGTLLAGVWGRGVYLSQDNGSTWIRTGQQLDVLSIMPFSSPGLIGAQMITSTWGNGVHVFHESASGWSELDRIPTSYVRTLAAIPDSFVFAGTFGKGVYRSDYGLYSWTAVNNGLGDLFTQSLTISGPYLLAGTYSNGVYRSSDRGNSWQHAGLAGAWVRALKTIGSTVFAGVVNTGVYRSTDHGATWTPANSGLGNYNIWAFAAAGPYIFVATDNGVYRSSDGGLSWTQSSLARNIVLSLDVVGTTLFAAIYGGSSSVVSSPDFGISWFDISAGLTTNLTRSLAHSSTYLYVGTEDRGVWRLPLSQVVSVNESRQVIPGSITLYQNHPNPFNPTTTIRFSVLSRQRVSLRLYDALGREVRTLFEGEVAAGEHSVVVNASDLASGVYVYRLDGGGFRLHKRMVVIR